MGRSVPSRVRVRVCNSRCAPRGVHCICCFLANRLLTTALTVASPKAEEMRSPDRNRSVVDQAVCIGGDVDSELVSCRDELGQVRIRDLQSGDLVLEAVDLIPDTIRIPMPEQPFDALEIIKQP